MNETDLWANSRAILKRHPGIALYPLVFFVAEAGLVGCAILYRQSQYWLIIAAGTVCIALHTLMRVAVIFNAFELKRGKSLSLLRTLAFLCSHGTFWLAIVVDPRLSNSFAPRSAARATRGLLIAHAIDAGRYRMKEVREIIRQQPVSMSDLGLGFGNRFARFVVAPMSIALVAILIFRAFKPAAPGWDWTFAYVAVIATLLVAGRFAAHLAYDLNLPSLVAERVRIAQGK